MAEDPEVKTFKEDYPDIYQAGEKMVEEAKPPEPPRPRTDPMATFHHYLNRDVPEWREINTDPEFISFLNAPDPSFPGMSKLQSIQATHDATDATTEVRHFQDFKRFREQKAAQQARLDKSEIAEFYKDAQKGKYGPVSGEKFKTEGKRILKPLIKPEG